MSLLGTEKFLKHSREYVSEIRHLNDRRQHNSEDNCLCYLL